MTNNIQTGINQNRFISEIISVINQVRMNIHYVLYIMAFFTFGIGDGFSGAYMMDKLGTATESNPIGRYLFMDYGFGGLVMAKVFYTLVILFAMFIIQFKFYKNMYWTINGLLFALSAGGMMAIYANMNALAGEVVQAPEEIIFIFLALMIILSEIGYFVDMRTAYPKNVGI